MLRLHNFHSSSTSFRARIALNLKGLAYENVPVTLRWEDGDHHKPEFSALNPQRNVPVLVDGETRVVQSLAVVDYLERLAPDPPLFPSDPGGRARVLAIALHVACEIQPMNNLRVQRQLVTAHGFDQEALTAWQRHWCQVGFDAIERMLASDPATGVYCHGDAPTVADCFLVPQVYNALRPVVGHVLSSWPTIGRIYEACLRLDAFERALPKNQPGFENIKEH